MKVKFYYSNGFCGGDEVEIVDFPNATRIDDMEICDYGDESLQLYMESWGDDRFVDYPDREDFETEDEYQEACNDAYDEYMENGEWWCEEYKEEDE